MANCYSAHRNVAFLAGCYFGQFVLQGWIVRLEKFENVEKYVFHFRTCTPLAESLMKNFFKFFNATDSCPHCLDDCKSLIIYIFYIKRLTWGYTPIRYPSPSSEIDPDSASKDFESRIKVNPFCSPGALTNCCNISSLDPLVLSFKTAS